MSERHSPEGFYRRSIRASVLIGVLGAVFAAVYAGPGPAARYALFTAWMLANLALWGFGLRELTGPRRPLFLYPLVAAKILWIAFLVLLCLWTGVGEKVENSVAFLLGFNTPFLVMFLKAVGSIVVGNTEKDGSRVLKTGNKQPHGDRSRAK